ncbi:putative ABC transporter ATP-binding protein [Candidatus Lokiarchaeum ossiferum]|uniref:ABC transporter ATP-binding protein n=1 Tax=Candidatus Lokiarchaeum ossiferum TaxID=2951803 RepID=A0ABY6HTV0_9ARCH|nr:putative ABC transporter ATP-binding protein [Candidatus Lokiarchaeum sp. B-35]
MSSNLKSVQKPDINKKRSNVLKEKSQDQGINLNEVSKTYYLGSIVVKALESVSVTIPKNKFVIILGPSGSGKTTLLNVIGALDVASDGNVNVLNKEITNFSRKQLSKFRRQHLGFIFQFFNLIPSLTALENVEFALQIQGKKKTELIAQNALKSVGLKERMGHFPSEMSGGEQQRVAIARALAKSPEILLADEPTGELDYETGIKILELLRNVVTNGKTVLMVTHNAEIAKIADVIIRLRSGKIIETQINENPINPMDLKW